MDITRFESSTMGHVVPISGVDAFLNRPYSHFAFVPEPLPSELAMSSLSIKLLSEADRALGRLDAASGRLPNPQLLVRPTLYREAVSTSALEGTYALFQDVLESDFVDEVSRSREVREVRNYVMAAAEGLDMIKSKPICVSILTNLFRRSSSRAPEVTPTTLGRCGRLRSTSANVTGGSRHRGSFRRLTGTSWSKA